MVASGIDSPIEIGYHAPTKSLLLSLHYLNGFPYNFARLDTNHVLTQWSGIANLQDEVKFAVSQVTTNGWTNGATYFGSGTSIGYLSSNATTANMSWSVLTNISVTNALYVRGSLCFDTTGIWSNDLIAVTSDALENHTYKKGVWRINSTGQPTLIANLDVGHLEGVVTVPNDPDKWGPWAGKILTGDETAEDANFQPNGIIYAVDNVGFAESFQLKIQAEDFDLIPDQQDLYCVFYAGLDSQILKVSKTLLHPYVGDILIAQAGEVGDFPALFIVHWDGSNFVTHRITIPGASLFGNFEHVTFAPLNY